MRGNCAHCGAEDAPHAWDLTACAMGGELLEAWLCGACDVELNRLTLEFFHVPGVDGIIERYSREESA
jgi:hypothetical protein